LDSGGIGRGESHCGEGLGKGGTVGGGSRWQIVDKTTINLEKIPIGIVMEWDHLTFFINILFYYYYILSNYRNRAVR
jgi:hypothetical protein